MTATIPVKPAVIEEAKSAMRAAMDELKKSSTNVAIINRLENARIGLVAAGHDDSKADLQGGF